MDSDVETKRLLQATHLARLRSGGTEAMKAISVSRQLSAFLWALVRVSEIECELKVVPPIASTLVADF